MDYPDGGKTVHCLVSVEDYRDDYYDFDEKRITNEP